MDEYNIGNSNRTIRSVQVGRDDIFNKAPANKSEIRNKVKTFDARMEKSPNLRKITEDRSKLPIASFKDNITSIVESHQRSHISLTITVLPESIQNELRTVEEMKSQCEQKRDRLTK